MPDDLRAAAISCILVLFWIVAGLIASLLMGGQYAYSGRTF
jgi:hypothetical protein